LISSNSSAGGWSFLTLSSLIAPSSRFQSAPATSFNSPSFADLREPGTQVERVRGHGRGIIRFAFGEGEMANVDPSSVNPYAARGRPSRSPRRISPGEAVFGCGRIGRARYITYGLGMYILIGILGGALSAVAGTVGQLLSFIAILAVVFMLTIQRCHDFNTTGWLSLLVLIPIVNLLFWFIPGQRGRQSLWRADAAEQLAHAGAGVVLSRRRRGRHPRGGRAACLPAVCEARAAGAAAAALILLKLLSRSRGRLLG